MSQTSMCSRPARKFLLTFQSFEGRETLSFPCDESGQVDLNTLPPVTKTTYLYARAVMGYQFRPPVVQRHEPQH